MATDESALRPLGLKIVTDLSDLGAGLREANGMIRTWAAQTRERFAEFEKGALALGAAATGLALALKGATAAFAEFEHKLNQIAAVSNATESDMEKIRAKALQLGADTQYSSSQAANGMFELAKAGFNTQQQLDAIGGSMDLASAAGMQVGEACETTAGILAGFGKEAGKAGYVADQLAQAANSSAVDVSDLSNSMKYVAPVARASNQSLSEMLGIMAVLGNNMIRGDQAGTTLRSAMVSLQKPSDDSATLMHKLGISIQDTQGRMLPMSDIINQLRDKTAKMSETQRANAVATIFGQEALSGMMVLMNQAPGTMEKMRAAQDNATGAAKRMSDVMNQGLGFQWEQLTGSIETLAIQVGEDLAPALSTIAQLVTGLVNALGAIPAPIRQFLTMFVATAAASMAVQGAIGGVLKLVPYIAPAFTAIASPVGLAVIGLTALATVLATVRGAMSQQRGASLQVVRGLEDESKRVSDLCKRHDELKAKTKLTKTEETERIKILKELRDISPSLVTGYNNEGDATEIAKGAVERYNRALREKIRLETKGLRDTWGTKQSEASTAWSKMKAKQQEVEGIEATLKRNPMFDGKFEDNPFWSKANKELKQLTENYKSLQKAAGDAREQVLLAEGSLTPEVTTREPNRGTGVTPPPPKKTTPKPKTPLQKAQESFSVDMTAAGGYADEQTQIEAKIAAHQRYKKALQEIGGQNNLIKKEEGYLLQLGNQLADVKEKKQLKALRDQNAAELDNIDTSKSQADQLQDQVESDEKLRAGLEGHKNVSKEILALDKKIQAGKLAQINAAAEQTETEERLKNNGELRGDTELKIEEQKLAALKATKAPLDQIEAQELRILNVKKSQVDAALDQAKAMAGLVRGGFDAVNTESLSEKKARLKALEKGLDKMATDETTPESDRVNRRQEIDDLRNEITKDEKKQKTAVPGFLMDNAGTIGQIPKMLTDMATGFNRALPALQAALPGLAPLFTALSGAATGLLGASAPLIPIAAAIVAGLALFMVAWQQNTTGIQEAFGNLVNSFSGIWDAVVFYMQPVIDGLGAAFSVLFNVLAIVVNIAKGVMTAFATVRNAVWDILSRFTPIGYLVKMIGVAFQAAWDAIINGYNWIAEKLSFLGMQKIAKPGEAQAAAETAADQKENSEIDGNRLNGVELARAKNQAGLLSDTDLLAALEAESKTKGADFLNNTQEGISLQGEITSLKEKIKADAEKNGPLTGLSLARAQNQAGIMSDADLLAQLNKAKAGMSADKLNTTSEGLSLLQEIKSLTERIEGNTKDTVEAFKSALSSITSYSPLPVKDVSKSGWFGAGNVGRFYQETKATLELLIKPMGAGVTKGDLIKMFQDPSVRQAAKEIVGVETGLAALNPKFS